MAMITLGAGAAVVAASAVFWKTVVADHRISALQMDWASFYDSVAALITGALFLLLYGLVNPTVGLVWGGVAALLLVEWEGDVYLLWKRWHKPSFGGMDKKIAKTSNVNGSLSSIEYDRTR